MSLKNLMCLKNTFCYWFKVDWFIVSSCLVSAEINELFLKILAEKSTNLSENSFDVPFIISSVEGSDDTF